MPASPNTTSSSRPTRSPGDRRAARLPWAPILASLGVVLASCGGEGGPPEAATSGAATPAAGLPATGSWTFQGTPLAEERPIEVWYHVPEGATAEAPIVIVLHGMGRNGDGYRDAWVAPADEHGFVVVVPQFSDALYPGSREYNLGNTFTAEGERLPPEDWSFTQIEAVFDDARSRLGLARDHYHLYGHSAGSQFAHRFLLFVPDARARRVVLANAGWYTLPTAEQGWPYGLGVADGAAVPPEQVAAFLARDVVVLLGDQDIDPAGSGLRTTPEAVAQGAHRFARGHHYFEVTRGLADAMAVDSPWQLDTVPDVGHSNARMAPAAARVIMEAEGG
jgi:poly(3-hydroxybutyrate) depolymerase